MKLKYSSIVMLFIMLVTSPTVFGQVVNDLCSDAIDLGSNCSITVSGTTVGATIDPVDACGTPITAPGVWYTIEGVGRDMTASTCNDATFDTKISVYSGTCGALVCVGGLDDSPGCGGFTTSFTWPSTLGTTYYILVHGFGSATGDFNLTVSSLTSPTISVAPTELNFAVPLDGSASDVVNITNDGACAQNLDWVIFPFDFDNSSSMMRSGQTEFISTTSSQELPVFRITKSSLNILRSENIPEDIIAKLESLQNQSSTDKETFFETLSTLLGETKESIYHTALFESTVIWPGEDVETNKEVKVEEKEGKNPPTPMLGGGPDPFGYSWIDSDEPGGPAFNWTDISSTGTEIISNGDWDFSSYGGADDAYKEVALPFTFNYYGVDYSMIKVSSNGFLTFGTDGTDYTNDPIPNPNVPNNIICAFWDDLLPDAGRTIHYLSTSSQFIVQYTNLDHYGTITGDYTFQVILNDDGSILYQYLDMQGTLNSATIGIENSAGTYGTQVAFDANYVHNNLAVRIYRPPLCTWLSASPTSGSVSGSNSQQITVGVDATGLSIGVYQCEFWIGSNATNNQVVTVPVTLYVGTPLERMDDLIAQVQQLYSDGVLNSGQANSLIVKLNAAKKSLNNGKTNTAINQLQAFINHVYDFIDEEVLTSEQGGKLISDAQIIIDFLQNGMQMNKMNYIANLGDEGNLPDTYTLSQNYPNPFNPTTTINFALPENANVTLKVYDIIGRQVAELVNGEVEAGYHQVVFDATKLSSGIYFYRLTTDKFTQINKMILMK